MSNDFEAQRSAIVTHMYDQMQTWLANDGRAVVDKWFSKLEDEFPEIRELGEGDRETMREAIKCKLFIPELEKAYKDTDDETPEGVAFASMMGNLMHSFKPNVPSHRDPGYDLQELYIEISNAHDELHNL